MLDIQLIRSNIAFVAERLATRGIALDTSAFEALEAERKSLQTRTQDLQARIGRSARLGARSIGVLDAGATSCWLILRTMAQSLQRQLAG